MKKNAILILCLIFSVFLTGCGKQEEREQLPTYQAEIFRIPDTVIHDEIVIAGKHVYYMAKYGEDQFGLEKLDMSTGETEKRNLEFKNCINIWGLGVDEAEEFLYYHFSIRQEDETVESGKNVEVYLVKETVEGETVYQKLCQYPERGEDIGYWLRFEVSDEGLLEIYERGTIILDEQGEVVSVQEGKAERKEPEYQDYEGYIWRTKDGVYSEKVFDLVESGLGLDDRVHQVERYEDGTFVGMGFPDKHIIYMFMPVRESQGQNAEEIQLVIGVTEMDPSLRAASVGFSKSGDGVNVTIKEYGGDGKSAEDAYNALKADIVAGRGPDIIAFAPGEDYRDLAERGALEDLQPYVDRSKTVREEDYVPFTWDICRQGGLLCGIPTEFSIQTLASKYSIVGEQSGITADEVYRLHKEYPQMALTEGETKLGVASIVLAFQAADYIDEKDRTAGFDKEAFYKLLKFADTFPARAAQDDREPLFYECYLYDVGSLMQVYDALGAEEVTFIGYPTTDGNLGYYRNQGGYLYAVNSRSVYKEACWEFIEWYLAERGNEAPRMFSTRRDILEKQFRRGVTAQDETEAEEYAGRLLKTFEEICEQPCRAQSWERVPAEILMEELQVYFAGQRDAEQTAKILENRIQNYLNEG